MNLLIRGNALRLPLADESVQCCVTSPPYWSLRDYSCVGQLGLESTPAEFVAKIVEVFREVKRVLRSDGTCFVNLGDSYAAGGSGGYSDKSTLSGFTNPATKGRQMNGELMQRKPPEGLKPKDLCGIPWRTALALQADGWYLRSDIIWSKPNPMPESVTDRPTKSHEYVFLLTKSERYYWDQEAVRTAHQNPEREANRPSRRENMQKAAMAGREFIHIADHQPSMDEPMAGHPNGRNMRSVWSIPESLKTQFFQWFNAQPKEITDTWQIPTESYPGAHFATYPRALVTPCVKAGSKQGDIVLDPFAGSGTTGVVAEALHRRFVGIDLSAEYLKMARNRIEHPHRHIPRPGRVEHHPLFRDLEAEPEAS